MNNIITNSLEKYSLKNSKLSGWKLCQKNENGNELIFTENSSVYHAVCGYKGEFAQAVWNFIQSDFSWQQARDLIGWERHLVRIAIKLLIIFLGIITLFVKRKTKTEMEADELSMLNKKNKLHLTQTLSTKNKLCYASNFI